MYKVVIVDDAPETLEINKRMLSDSCYVEAFGDGLSAITYLMNNRPDIVLLDIEMPFMDGFAVLEKIKQMTNMEGVPIVGLTGKTERTTVLKFITGGGAGYIVKPAQKEALLAKIAEVVEKANAKQHQKKILLVDDEMEALAAHKAVLQTQYSVMGINSSRRALEYLNKFTPDLIILDYQMPLMSGKELFRFIRSSDRLKNVPVLFFTGSSEADVLKELSSIGAAGVVHKSAGHQALLALVKDMFAKLPEE